MKASRIRSLTSGLLLAIGCAGAFACGVCVEDKMAATYDDAVVQKAAGKKHLVVFCDVTGHASAEQLMAATRGVPGIDPDSVRASAQPAALSFSVDPAKQTPEGAVSLVAQRAGAGAGVELLKTLFPKTR